jgi:hypothetical protein
LGCLATSTVRKKRNSQRIKRNNKIIFNDNKINQRDMKDLPNMVAKINVEENI